MSSDEPFDGPGGGGDPPDDQPDDPNNNPDLPSWIPGSAPSWWSTAEEWFSNPAAKVRNVVYGMLITGIAWFVEPVFDAVLLVLGGSQPATLGAPGETWGLTDLPVVIARIAGDAVAFPIEQGLGALASLIELAVPTAPGPLDGIFVTVVIVAVVVALFRYGPLLLRSLLEAIPVIGGPLATLLGGAGGDD